MLSFVTGSSGSSPVSGPRTAARSATVRAIGPAVSWLCAMGMMPERLSSPSDGLMPASALSADGQVTEPSVSVPRAAAHRFAEGAAPEPELDPHGLWSSTYGFKHWPARALHPLDDWKERKLAHSERFVLPRMTAPTSRSCLAMKESLGTFEPTSAREPAVVFILSRVAMLSLIRMGIPCRMVRGPVRFLSRSSCS